MKSTDKNIGNILPQAITQVRKTKANFLLCKNSKGYYYVKEDTQKRGFEFRLKLKNNKGEVICENKEGKTERIYKVVKAEKESKQNKD